MAGTESFLISIERLPQIAQRYRWWIHAMLYPLGWACIYALNKVPPLDVLIQWILSGTSKMSSLGHEWFALIQLAVARIYPLDEFGYFINRWVCWILFWSIFFILPQILFWAFRTKRKKLWLGIVVFVSINLFSFYMHGFYCVWGYNRVSILIESMPATDLLRQCGQPLYYRKSLYNKEPCWMGVYADGNNSKQVYFMDNGIAHISGTREIWMD